ncbi:MAG: SGNH/GDSL hydrolase family protein [Deltaproteobacteria bacterium]|nr:SGNH/GDSL hydrolase family protein [Deltaproteobacteria bacterium]
MRGSAIGLRLAAVMLGVAAAVGILEILLRVASLAPLPAQLQDIVRDEAIGFRRRPGSVLRGGAESGEFAFEYAHNSLGFRDVEHAAAKPSRTLRIVALGDSFTYGVGAAFADTYLAQVERRLNERAGTDRAVEIIKLGMPRHFPLLERRTLEEYGLRFAPDIVMVAVLPNDVVDTALGATSICATDTGYLVSCGGLDWGGLPAWLSLHSALGRFALRQVRSNHLPPWQALLADDGAYEPSWRELEAELTRMRELAQAHGAAFVVVTIPQSDPVESQSYFSTRLERWGAAHDAIVIPTFAALQAAADPVRPLYWARDGHCTAAGYTVVADAIIAGLAAHGLAE